MPEAEEAARGLGVEIVPAIEMSCVHEYAEDLHICGYWVDLEKIEPACERAQQERRDRAGEIVENLRGLGFDLTLDDAIREAGGADSIGRPHIAKAAGATGDLGPFFEEYLVPGAKAFVPRRWPTAEQAIELIREAGGVAVIAHPYWDISEPGEVDDLIRSLGADGVETFYPTHSKEQTEHLLELCDELDLVPTASSDYHGPTHKTFAKFGAYDTYGLGEPRVPRAVPLSGVRHPNRHKERETATASDGTVDGAARPILARGRAAETGRGRQEAPENVRRVAGTRGRRHGTPCFRARTSSKCAFASVGDLIPRCRIDPPGHGESTQRSDRMRRRMEGTQRTARFTGLASPELRRGVMHAPGAPCHRPHPRTCSRDPFTSWPSHAKRTQPARTATRRPGRRD